MIPKITYVKAFTENPTLGNPAVVIEAPIDSKNVLAIIKKSSCPVATVIDSDQEIIPIRFFYEYGETEVFTCGHAALAAAHVVLTNELPKRRFINAKGDHVDVIRLADGRISQEHRDNILFKECPCSKEELANVLGLQKGQISKDLPIKLVGFPEKMKLMIPISWGELLSIQRNFQKIKLFCDSHSFPDAVITGLFPFALEVEDCDAHARHFPNRDEEDLVCGVGAMALAKYLQQYSAQTQKQFKIRCGPGKTGMGDLFVRLDETLSLPKIYLDGYAVTVNSL